MAVQKVRLTLTFPLDNAIQGRKLTLVVRKTRTQTRSRGKGLSTPCATLQEWMERTGTNGRQLLALLRERGETMSEGHLSNILKGSRRCSLGKAILLNEITGVPIREIARWPHVRDDRTSKPAA